MGGSDAQAAGSSVSRKALAAGIDLALTATTTPAAGTLPLTFTIPARLSRKSEREVCGIELAPIRTKYLHVLRQIVMMLSLCFLFTTANAQDRAGINFFESKIRPVLIKHCYECHSNQSGKSKGGLKVDSRDGLLRGGESGAAIVERELANDSLRSYSKRRN